MFLATQPAVAASDSGSHLAVVELFTSQGCSSCPPADKLVGSYADTPGVLPLSFHVSYWNYLGWDDPYSKEGFTKRQQAYKNYLGRFNIYTPQAVVQGQYDVVGSQAPALKQALGKATHSSPWVNISLRKDGDTVQITIPETAGLQARLFIVGYLKRVENQVMRGENAGETLMHRNSVVDLIYISDYDGKPLMLKHPIPAGDGIALLLQSKDSGAIIGASTL